MRRIPGLDSEPLKPAPGEEHPEARSVEHE
jgi:hypothetical protein